MEALVNLCKVRGYVYPGSEIYGGLANAWDFGPLGVELRRNIKDAWWKAFIQGSEYNVGIESAILMNPRTWEASGHLSNFTDPLMDCRTCKSRFRADQIIKDALSEDDPERVRVEGWTADRMRDYIAQNGLKCPVCGSTDFTDVRQFNMMFKTYQGVTEDSKSEIYLRPETAQGMFVNFKNVQRTTRRKIPFWHRPDRKSFRNEITPGNFIFRTREFEQMELEFFCEPGTDLEWFATEAVLHRFSACSRLEAGNLRMRDHAPEELSHYSRATADIEYRFPFDGASSGESLTEQIMTWLSTPSFGRGHVLSRSDHGSEITSTASSRRWGSSGWRWRSFATHDEETLEDGETRTVLRPHSSLAPIKAAVLPLSKKLSEDVRSIPSAARTSSASSTSLEA